MPREATGEVQHFPTQVTQSVEFEQIHRVIYIANHRFSLLIPKDWHRISSLVGRVGPEIQLVQILFTEQVIHCCAGVLIARGWKTPSWPAGLVTLGVWFDDADANEIGQALEVKDKVYTMREGTKKTDVEVVTAFLSRKFVARDDAMPTVSGCELMNEGH